MIIGIDFDNTIINYDEVFYLVAKERFQLHQSIPINKVAVREFLRSTGNESSWTEMQGYVYGERMNDAKIFPGFLSFLNLAKNNGHIIYVISHKTKHPVLGPKYDLRKAAYDWISANTCLNHENIYFESTKEDKIKRISSLKCDAFIDDLPEILESEFFPVDTRRLLFDPESNHEYFLSKNLKRLGSWDQICEEFGLRC